jgi:hypothetical protein
MCNNVWHFKSNIIRVFIDPYKASVLSMEQTLEALYTNVRVGYWDKTFVIRSNDCFISSSSFNIGV